MGLKELVDLTMQLVPEVISLFLLPSKVDIDLKKSHLTRLWQ